ncbi:65-kDa microtubule-associated protein 1 [Linum perenne]
MAVTDTQNPLVADVTCSTLLQRLQEIWDEVGENDDERDKMLLQIDQECLDVYKRKVEQAANSRAELLQTLSDANIELSTLISSLGDKSSVGIPEKTSGTIKEQLEAIAPALEQLWKQKEERVNEFSDVQSQIQKICREIAGSVDSDGTPAVDESDLSLKRLNEYHAHLQELQKEKSERLHKVLEFVSSVHDLCAVLGLDFFSTVTEVHPSLNESTGVQSKSISNDTLASLAKTVLELHNDKIQRLHKLQELATQLTDLWNLMDTPVDERKLFDHVTCNISATVDEVTMPGSLALDLIEQAEVEVERLDLLKFSRMKEIAFKKQSELEDIYARAHIEIDPEAAREKIMALINSGNIEPTELLADMDSQISKAKEEALSRKEILDKVEKWMSACEEESWLEDYNRVLLTFLLAKTRGWEAERDLQFTYDGVPLLAMLDEYAMLRQEREEEKRRMKDQKKQHEQQSTDQEAAFGSRASPARPVSAKKVAGPRAIGGGTNGGTPSRRLSMNNTQNGSSRSGAASKDRREARLSAPPTNQVTISKEDASHASGTESIPVSP